MTSFLHTYLSKVKSWSFIIATLIIVAFIALGANIDRIIALFDDDTEILVEVDASEEFYEQFSENLLLDEERFSFTNEVSEELEENVVLVEVTEEYPVKATMHSITDIPNNLNNSIRLALNEVNRVQAVNEIDVTEEEIALLNSVATIDYDVQDQDITIGESGEIITFSTDLSVLNLIIFNVGLFVMFFTIINYASQIGTEIAMEKSSRVIEIILSSMPPVKHLVAKILGIFAVALTQLLIFVVAGLLLFSQMDFGGTLSDFGIEMNDSSLQMIVLTLIYIVLGMFLYLAISAMLGSFISRMEDLQQGILPMTMLVIAGFYIGIFNAATGENMLTEITSYIPFFTPFVMPLRALHSPENLTVQYIGIAIMLVSIVVALALAARVYRGSVLSTEKGIMKNFKRVFGKK